MKIPIYCALLAFSSAASNAALVTTDLLYFWDASDDPTATASTWTSKQGSQASDDTWSVQTNTTRQAVTSSTLITDAYDFTGFAGNVNDLNGTATRLEFAASSGITGLTSGFELWIKPDALNNGRQMIFESGGATRGFGLSLWEDELRFAIKRGQASGNAPAEILTHTLSGGDINDFIQVVINIDATNFDIELYVNPLGGTGLDTAKDTDSWTSDNPYGTSDASLGGINNGSGNGEIGGGDDDLNDPWGRNNFVGFEGQIGIMRVYDDVLTGTEVETNFTATIPEPAGFALLGLSGALFALRRRR